MKARMDDPLDAVPVHFGGGVLGVICGPIFKVCLDIFFPNAWLKTSFCTIFSYVILGWYHDNFSMKIK